VLTHDSMPSSFISLYLVHDVMDARFRRVQYLNFISLLYIVYFVSAGAAISFYVLVQWTHKSFQEVGAAVVALLVSSYGFWKLLRLQRILSAHKRLVDNVIVTAERTLVGLTKESQVREFPVNYLDKPGTHYLAHVKNKPVDRYLYLASSIFGTFCVAIGVSCSSSGRNRCLSTIADLSSVTYSCTRPLLSR
jgi:hypothetical protein